VESQPMGLEEEHVVSSIEQHKLNSEEVLFDNDILHEMD
jgi:hypothetical protein